MDETSIIENKIKYFKEGSSTINKYKENNIMNFCTAFKSLNKKEIKNELEIIKKNMEIINQNIKSTMDSLKMIYKKFDDISTADKIDTLYNNCEIFLNLVNKKIKQKRERADISIFSYMVPELIFLEDNK